MDDRSEESKLSTVWPHWLLLSGRPRLVAAHVQVEFYVIIFVTTEMVYMLELWIIDG